MAAYCACEAQDRLVRTCEASCEAEELVIAAFAVMEAFEDSVGHSVRQERPVDLAWQVEERSIALHCST